MPRISRGKLGIYNKTCEKDLASSNNRYYYYVKCAHDVHCHDDCRCSSNDESREDPVTSLASKETQTSMLLSVASRTHENYHLASFHIPKKNRLGDVPHKSPGNNAPVEHESGLKKKLVQIPSRVPRSLSLNLDIFADDVMNDDVSMDDSFIKLLEGDGQAEEPGLDIHDSKTTHSSIDSPHQWKLVLD
jgi:hypothetical protein